MFPRLTLVAVRGESMRPTIRHGDLLVVLSLTGHPHRGQVVVILAPMWILVHRLVGQARGASGRVVYHTAGDANRRDDAFVVPREAILGVARARLPWLGFPHLWATRLLMTLSSRTSTGPAPRGTFGRRGSLSDRG